MSRPITGPPELENAATIEIRNLVGLLVEMSRVTHQLAEERSLALHCEVARRLRERPELLNTARRRVQGWLETGRVSRFWAEAWDEALDGSLDQVIARITDTSDEARALRQSSPFAGVLGPRERWEILRQHRGQAAAS